MNTQAENFVEKLREGVSIFIEDCEAKIGEFWSLDFELENMFAKHPRTVLDRYLEKNKILSRDQMRAFIELLEKYRSAKNRKESGRRESESDAMSNQSDSLTDYMNLDSPSDEKSFASPSFNLLSSLSDEVFERSMEEIYLKFYKVETIETCSSEDVSDEDFEELIEKINQEVTLSEIAKKLKSFTSKEFIETSDDEKFLEKLQKRTEKDDDNLRHMIDLCSKEIIKQKRIFCYKQALDIYNTVSSLKGEMKSSKSPSQISIMALPVKEVTKSDMEALLIALHEVMHKIMNTDLDFIRSTIESEVWSKMYKLIGLEVSGDKNCIFAYDQSTETIILAKCIEINVQLERKQEAINNLLKVACECILHYESEMALGKVTLDLINILKKPSCKPEYAEIKDAMFNDQAYFTIKRTSRQSNRGHLAITATPSVDTLAGAEEIKDECKCPLE